MSRGKVVEEGFVEDLKQKYVLVHGDAENAEKAKHLMISFSGNKTIFEGIAFAEDADALRELDAAIEIPTLQQLSVGILRKAEEYGKE